MEQFKQTTPASDSSRQASCQAAGVVAFDVLRAMIAARQAASPTARILADQRGHTHRAAPAAESDSLISLFARGGATPVPGSFARDEAVIRQDDRHA